MPLMNLGLVAMHGNGAMMLRSAQPPPEALPLLQRLNVGKNYKFNDVPVPWMTAAGIEVVPCPMDAMFPPTVLGFGMLVGMMEADFQSGITIIGNCDAGRDRTGYAFGARRALIDKWPFEKIMAERSTYIWGVPEVLDDLFDRIGIGVLRELSAGNR